MHRSAARNRRGKVQRKRAVDGVAADHRGMPFSRRARQLLEQRPAPGAEDGVGGAVEPRELVEELPRGCPERQQVASRRCLCMSCEYSHLARGLHPSCRERWLDKEGSAECSSPGLQIGVEEVRHLHVSNLFEACARVTVPSFKRLLRVA